VGCLIAVGGYLLGSVLPAMWFVKQSTGHTPQQFGDNPGGAGVWRQVGPVPAVLTVLFDMAKGILPVALANYLGLTGHWIAIAAAAPVAGHNWPIYYRFKGGRGLASATGVLLFIAPREASPAYLLGVLAFLYYRWVPIIGVVAFPISLCLICVHEVPAEVLEPALVVIILTAFRQMSWLVGAFKKFRRGSGG